MATDPSFASVPNVGAALLGAAETSTQTPTTTSTVLTAGASGTKVEEIVVEASKATLITTTAAGLVYIFLHDGATFFLFDVVTVTATTGSATAQGFRQANRYANLILKAGWSIRCSQSIAGNASMLVVTALGADF